MKLQLTDNGKKTRDRYWNVCIILGIIGFIMIGNHHADADKIGPAISVAFLPIFYGYFIKLISTGLEKIGDD